MKLILKVLLTAVAVIAIASFFPGVTLDGYGSAIIVAIVLGLLKITVKPILVIFTLPATILTLGLFLFVINAVVVLIADSLISGFDVSGFWVALGFSLLLSLFQSILYSFLKDSKEK